MEVIKIIGPTVLTFFIGIFITPFFTHYFYKHKMWKKSPRVLANTSQAFNDIHNTESEVSTPRIGGVIIWVAVLLSMLVIYLFSLIYPSELARELNFFSRNQTLVPLGAFIFAALLGLTDDFFHISGKGSYAKDSLIYRRVKIIFVTLIGVAISFWFYFKLDFNSIHVPFVGDWIIGLWFIPAFIIVMLATFSTSVIDGLDGLAGGVMASIFAAYAVIAFAQNQMDISALCGALAGAILAFLWFNIPPARFYMGETGMLALCILLSVVAFLTDTVLLLPVIALPLVATTASVIIQINVYKFFNHRRVFRVAPLHHHFQALGWSKEKVVMRYWVVSVVFATLGVILVLIS
ncbi:MAG: phospho-N-acetylmuramoyl-pentapeptide-transferase [Patescibacteria group bacterium]